MKLVSDIFNKNFGGSRDKAAEVAYVIILLSLILDISGDIGIKYLSFVMAIFYYFFSKKVIFSKNFFISEGVIFFLLPIFFVLLSISVYGLNFAIVFSNSSFFLMWIIYPLLLKIPRAMIVKRFMQVMLFAACAMLVLFFLLSFLGNLPLLAKLSNELKKLNMGYFGQKYLFEVAQYIPLVYFRWSQLLIPTAVLFAGEGVLIMGVIFGAVVITFSTAIIYSSIIGLILMNFFVLKNKFFTRKRVVVSLISLFLLMLIVIFTLYKYWYLVGVINSKFSVYNRSTNVKILHIKSIVDLLSNNVSYFLFGTGVGSSFYSLGAQGYVVNVEVSHFNLAREFGVPYAVIFCLYIINVLRNLWRTDIIGKKLSIGLLMLFVASGTNPLLMSPVFFIILIICRAYVYRYFKETLSTAVY